ncbi:DUF4176 domain-containing protein [Bacillus wiedmannii]|uniref:DUF4176 domain-containing protein n=1 Tax=Bacillus wiedmannii TaxID=1890302 RepID=UPI0021D38929|nr:DUF4176 domain-containing protein [Bacillus wiedmannii]MCU5576174.1 DUF4176 domain-containing protein [Bacillus wiedmannii]
MQFFKEKFLPNGSIVLLKGGTKKIVIYGRKQGQVNGNKMWDYVSCPYPHGNLSKEYNVFFKGFETVEELELRNKLSKF